MTVLSELSDDVTFTTLPPVLNPPNSLTAQEGDDVTIIVPVSSKGGEPIDVYWTRGDQQLVGERYFSSTSKGAVTLTVRNTGAGDGGTYSFSARNLGGETSGDVLLDVVARPGGVPAFLRRLNDLAVKVGTRTRFLVEIRSATEVKVTWDQDGRLVEDNERFHLLNEGSFFCVDVAPVTLDDAGRWSCQAKNSEGSSLCSCQLNVLVPKAYKKPFFVEDLVALLTEQGTVSLECKVVGVPTPTLRWFKDNQEIKAGDVFALSANPKDPTSLGTYTCEATNCMGKAYSTSKVQVLGTSREGSLQPAESLIPKGPPPAFSQELKSTKVKMGESLTLECRVTVPPWPKSIDWFNKEGLVEEGDRYHLMADGLGGYSVAIKTLEAADEGEWKCVATSEAGVKGITTCRLTMPFPKNYRKPRFLESLKAILTEEGLVSFECKVVGFPTPQLRWFKDGQELKPGDVYHLTGTNSLGSYCCIAKNCMGEASSTAELTVEDIQSQLNEEERLQLFTKNQPPKFIQGLKSSEAKICEAFKFTVQVSVSPQPTVCWYRDDEEVQMTERYNKICETKGFCHLAIKRLEFMDQAEWKCVATNDYGQSVTSCFLKLCIPKQYKKPRFLENLRAVLSEEGAVNLECKVIGVPQPSLKWYKDGRELKPGDIHRIISGEDGTCCLGTYTCEAYNCMGTVSSSASLLGFEDRAQVKPPEPVKIPLAQAAHFVRQPSLSTIHEERTSQLHDTTMMEDKGEVSFSFDGKEVSVSLYETPDLTEEQALQVVEMYAEELSEHVSEHNVVELPPMRFVKETSTSGHLIMEAVVIDVSPDYYASAEEDLRTDADLEEFSIMDDHGMASPNILSPDEMPFDQITPEFLERTLATSGLYVDSGEKIPPSKPPRKKHSDASESFYSTKDNKAEEDKSESYADALGSERDKSQKDTGIGHFNQGNGKTNVMDEELIANKEFELKMQNTSRSRSKSIDKGREISDKSSDDNSAVRSIPRDQRRILMKRKSTDSEREDDSLIEFEKRKAMEVEKELIGASTMIATKKRVLKKSKSTDSEKEDDSLHEFEHRKSADKSHKVEKYIEQLGTVENIVPEEIKPKSGIRKKESSDLSGKDEEFVSEIDERKKNTSQIEVSAKQTSETPKKRLSRRRSSDSSGKDEQTILKRDAFPSMQSEVLSSKEKSEIRKSNLSRKMSSDSSGKDEELLLTKEQQQSENLTQKAKVDGTKQKLTKKRLTDSSEKEDVAHNKDIIPKEYTSSIKKTEHPKKGFFKRSSTDSSEKDEEVPLGKDILDISSRKKKKKGIKRIPSTETKEQTPETGVDVVQSSETESLDRASMSIVSRENDSPSVFGSVHGKHLGTDDDEHTFDTAEDSAYDKSEMTVLESLSHSLQEIQLGLTMVGEAVLTESSDNPKSAKSSFSVIESLAHPINEIQHGIELVEQQINEKYQAGDYSASITGKTILETLIRPIQELEKNLAIVQQQSAISGNDETLLDKTNHSILETISQPLQELHKEIELIHQQAIIETGDDSFSDVIQSFRPSLLEVEGGVQQTENEFTSKVEDMTEATTIVQHTYAHSVEDLQRAFLSNADSVVPVTVQEMEQTEEYSMTQFLKEIERLEEQSMIELDDYGKRLNVCIKTFKERADSIENVEIKDIFKSLGNLISPLQNLRIISSKCISAIANIVTTKDYSDKNERKLLKESLSRPIYALQSSLNLLEDIASSQSEREVRGLGLATLYSLSSPIDELQTTIKLIENLSPNTAVEFLSPPLEHILSSVSSIDRLTSKQGFVENVREDGIGLIKNLDDSIEIILNCISSIEKYSLELETKRSSFSSLSTLTKPLEEFQKQLHLAENFIIHEDLNTSPQLQVSHLTQELGRHLQALRMELSIIQHQIEVEEYTDEPPVVVQLLEPFEKVVKSIVSFHESVVSKPPDEPLHFRCMLFALKELTVPLNELCSSLMKTEEKVLQIPSVSDPNLGLRLVAQTIHELNEAFSLIQLQTQDGSLKKEVATISHVLAHLTEPFRNVESGLLKIIEQKQEEETQTLNINLFNILEESLKSLQTTLIETEGQLKSEQLPESISYELIHPMQELQRSILVIQDQVSFEYGDEPLTIESNIVTLHSLVQPIQTLCRHVLNIGKSISIQSAIPSQPNYVKTLKTVANTMHKIQGKVSSMLVKQSRQYIDKETTTHLAEFPIFQELANSLGDFERALELLVTLTANETIDPVKIKTRLIESLQDFRIDLVDVHKQIGQAKTQLPTSERKRIDIVATEILKMLTFLSLETDQLTRSSVNDLSVTENVSNTCGELNNVFTQFYQLLSEIDEIKETVISESSQSFDESVMKSQSRSTLDHIAIKEKDTKTEVIEVLTSSTNDLEKQLVSMKQDLSLKSNEKAEPLLKALEKAIIPVELLKHTLEITQSDTAELDASPKTLQELLSEITDSMSEIAELSIPVVEQCTATHLETISTAITKMSDAQKTLETVIKKEQVHSKSVCVLENKELNLKENLSPEEITIVNKLNSSAQELIEQISAVKEAPPRDLDTASEFIKVSTNEIESFANSLIQLQLILVSNQAITSSTPDFNSSQFSEQNVDEIINNIKQELLKMSEHVTIGDTETKYLYERPISNLLTAFRALEHDLHTEAIIKPYQIEIIEAIIKPVNQFKKVIDIDIADVKTSLEKSVQKSLKESLLLNKQQDQPSSGINETDIHKCKDDINENAIKHLEYLAKSSSELELGLMKIEHAILNKIPESVKASSFNIEILVQPISELKEHIVALESQSEHSTSAETMSDQSSLSMLQSLAEPIRQIELGVKVIQEQVVLESIGQMPQHNSVDILHAIAKPIRELKNGIALIQEQAFIMETDVEPLSDETKISSLETLALPLYELKQALNSIIELQSVVFEPVVEEIQSENDLSVLKTLAQPIAELQKKLIEIETHQIMEGDIDQWSIKEAIVALAKPVHDLQEGITVVEQQSFELAEDISFKANLSMLKALAQPLLEVATGIALLSEQEVLEDALENSTLSDLPTLASITEESINKNIPNIEETIIFEGCIPVKDNILKRPVAVVQETKTAVIKECNLIDATQEKQVMNGTSEEKPKLKEGGQGIETVVTGVQDVGTIEGTHIMSATAELKTTSQESGQAIETLEMGAQEVVATKEEQVQIGTTERGQIQERGLAVETVVMGAKEVVAMEKQQVQSGTTELKPKLQESSQVVETVGMGAQEIVATEEQQVQTGTAELKLKSQESVQAVETMVMGAREIVVTEEQHVQSGTAELEPKSKESVQAVETVVMGAKEVVAMEEQQVQSGTTELKPKLQESAHLVETEVMGAQEIVATEEQQVQTGTAELMLKSQESVQAVETMVMGAREIVVTEEQHVQSGTAELEPKSKESVQAVETVVMGAKEVVAMEEQQVQSGTTELKPKLQESAHLVETEVMGAQEIVATEEQQVQTGTAELMLKSQENFQAVETVVMGAREIAVTEEQHVQSDTAELEPKSKESVQAVETVVMGAREIVVTEEQHVQSGTAELEPKSKESVQAVETVVMGAKEVVAMEEQQVQSGTTKLKPKLHESAQVVETLVMGAQEIMATEEQQKQTGTAELKPKSQESVQAVETVVMGAQEIVVTEEQQVQIGTAELKTQSQKIDQTVETVVMGTREVVATEEQQVQSGTTELKPKLQESAKAVETVVMGVQEFVTTEQEQVQTGNAALKPKLQESVQVVETVVMGAQEIVATEEQQVQTGTAKLKPKLQESVQAVETVVMGAREIAETKEQQIQSDTDELKPKFQEIGQTVKTVVIGAQEVVAREEQQVKSVTAELKPKSHESDQAIETVVIGAQEIVATEERQVQIDTSELKPKSQERGQAVEMGAQEVVATEQQQVQTGNAALKPKLQECVQVVETVVMGAQEIVATEEKQVKSVTAELKPKSHESDQAIETVVIGAQEIVATEEQQVKSVTAELKPKSHESDQAIETVVIGAQEIVATEEQQVQIDTSELKPKSQESGQAVETVVMGAQEVVAMEEQHVHTLTAELRPKSQESGQAVETVVMGAQEIVATEEQQVQIGTSELKPKSQESGQAVETVVMWAQEIVLMKEQQVQTGTAKLKPKSQESVQVVETVVMGAKEGVATEEQQVQCGTAELKPKSHERCHVVETVEIGAQEVVVTEEKQVMRGTAELNTKSQESGQVVETVVIGAQEVVTTEEQEVMSGTAELNTKSQERGQASETVVMVAQEVVAAEEQQVQSGTAELKLKSQESGQASETVLIGAQEIVATEEQQVQSGTAELKLKSQESGQASETVVICAQEIVAMEEQQVQSGTAELKLKSQESGQASVTVVIGAQEIVATEEQQVMNDTAELKTKSQESGQVVETVVMGAQEVVATEEKQVMSSTAELKPKSQESYQVVETVVMGAQEGVATLEQEVQSGTAELKPKSQESYQVVETVVMGAQEGVASDKQQVMSDTTELKPKSQEIGQAVETVVMVAQEVVANEEKQIISCSAKLKPQSQESYQAVETVEMGALEVGAMDERQIIGGTVELKPTLQESTLAVESSAMGAKAVVAMGEQQAMSATAKLKPQLQESEQAVKTVVMSAQEVVATEEHKVRSERAESKPKTLEGGLVVESVVIGAQEVVATEEPQVMSFTAELKPKFQESDQGIKTVVIGAQEIVATEEQQVQIGTSELKLKSQESGQAVETVVMEAQEVAATEEQQLHIGTSELKPKSLESGQAVETVVMGAQEVAAKEEQQVQIGTSELKPKSQESGKAVETVVMGAQKVAATEQQVMSGSAGLKPKSQESGQAVETVVMGAQEVVAIEEQQVQIGTSELKPKSQESGQAVETVVMGAQEVAATEEQQVQIGTSELKPKSQESGQAVETVVMGAQEVAATEEQQVMSGSAGLKPKSQESGQAVETVVMEAQEVAATEEQQLHIGTSELKPKSQECGQAVETVVMRAQEVAATEEQQVMSGTSGLKSKSQESGQAVETVVMGVEQVVATEERQITGDTAELKPKSEESGQVVETVVMGAQEIVAVKEQEVMSGTAEFKSKSLDCGQAAKSLVIGAQEVITTKVPSKTAKVEPKATEISTTFETIEKAAQEVITADEQQVMSGIKNNLEVIVDSVEQNILSSISDCNSLSIDHNEGLKADKGVRRSVRDQAKGTVENENQNDETRQPKDQVCTICNEGIEKKQDIKNKAVELDDKKLKADDKIKVEEERLKNANRKKSEDKIKQEEDKKKDEERLKEIEKKKEEDGKAEEERVKEAERKKEEDKIKKEEDKKKEEELLKEIEKKKEEDKKAEEKRVKKTERKKEEDKRKKEEDKKREEERLKEIEKKKEEDKKAEEERLKETERKKEEDKIKQEEDKKKEEERLKEIEKKNEEDRKAEEERVKKAERKKEEDHIKNEEDKEKEEKLLKVIEKQKEKERKEGDKKKDEERLKEIEKKKEEDGKAEEERVKEAERKKEEDKIKKEEDKKKEEERLKEIEKKKEEDRKAEEERVKNSERKKEEDQIKKEEEKKKEEERLKIIEKEKEKGRQEEDKKKDEERLKDIEKKKEEDRKVEEERVKETERKKEEDKIKKEEDKKKEGERLKEIERKKEEDRKVKEERIKKAERKKEEDQIKKEEDKKKEKERLKEIEKKQEEDGKAEEERVKEAERKKEEDKLKKEEDKKNEQKRLKEIERMKEEDMKKEEERLKEIEKKKEKERKGKDKKNDEERLKEIEKMKEEEKNVEEERLKQVERKKEEDKIKKEEDKKKDEERLKEIERKKEEERKEEIQRLKEAERKKQEVRKEEDKRLKDIDRKKEEKRKEEERMTETESCKEKEMKEEEKLLKTLETKEEEDTKIKEEEKIQKKQQRKEEEKIMEIARNKEKDRKEEEIKSKNAKEDKHKKDENKIEVERLKEIEIKKVEERKKKEEILSKEEPQKEEGKKNNEKRSKTVVNKKQEKESLKKANKRKEEVNKILEEYLNDGKVNKSEHRMEEEEDLKIQEVKTKEIEIKEEPHSRKNHFGDCRTDVNSLNAGKQGHEEENKLKIKFELNDNTEHKQKGIREGMTEINGHNLNTDVGGIKQVTESRENFTEKYTRTKECSYQTNNLDTDSFVKNRLSDDVFHKGMAKSKSCDPENWKFDSNTTKMKWDDSSEMFRYSSSVSSSSVRYTRYSPDPSVSAMRDFNRIRRDAKDKPTFCGRLVDRTTGQGCRVKLTCSFTGSPDPGVEWLKDGQSIVFRASDPITSRYYMSSINGIASLEIESAALSDSGRYTCIAKNEHGQSSSTCKLKVFGQFEPSPQAPIFTRPIKDTYRIAADELVIDCRVRAQPAAMVTWYKDNVPLRALTRYQQTELADGLCKLVIYGPEPSDSGLYTCKAENNVCSEQVSSLITFQGRDMYRVSRSVDRRSKTPVPDHKEVRRPRFSSVLTDSLVPEGGTVALQVEIKGHTQEVTWFRGTEILPKDSSRYRYLREGDVHSLVLPEASSSESGTYTCRAVNAYGHIDTSASVEVVGTSNLRGKSAMFVTRPDTSMYVALGEDINICFRLTGDPRPRVVWMKGIKDITNSPRTMKEMVDNYVKLTLKRATSMDAGTYFIVIKNSYGSDRAFVTVQTRTRARSLTPSIWAPVDTATILKDIHEEARRRLANVPGPIASEPVVSDAGKNWITISWTKPGHRGGAPILAYKVEAWELGSEGGAMWNELGMTPSSCFDTFNLKPGGSYKFRVTARNRYGWGESVTNTEPILVGYTAFPPDIVRDLPGQLKALQGRKLILDCEIRGDPSPDIRWYVDGQEVDVARRKTDRITASKDGDRCILTIRELSQDDSGRYICEANNKLGRSSTFARLLVVDDPKLLEAESNLKRGLSEDFGSLEHAPQFTMRLRDRRVQVTYPVRLTCQISGLPAPKVMWFHEGLEVLKDERHNFIVEDHFYTLDIPCAMLDDSGIYTVSASNDLGSVSCHCHLVVDKGIRAYIAPEFIGPLDVTCSVNEGGELRLFAQVEAYPSVGIAWHRDGIRLRPSRRLIMTLDRDGHVELALARITLRDAGVYMCTAANAVGRTQTTCQVTVTQESSVPEAPSPLPVVVSPSTPYSKEPKFLMKPRSSEAVEGDTVVIICEVVGDPKPEVIWLRDWLKPGYYRDSPQFRIVGEGPQYRLEIPQVKLDFTGAYSVIARNPHGEAKAIISLQIYAKGQGKESSMVSGQVKHGKVHTLPEIIRELKDLRCCDGDSVTLECRVQAIPIPDIRWEKGGKLIHLGGDWVADQEGEVARLTIKKVYPEDEGEYSCVAYNDLGRAVTSACLVVDVPEEKETQLRQQLSRPPGLLSAESTPRSTPRSTPSRSVSPCVTKYRDFSTPLGDRPRRVKMSSPKFYSVPHNKVAEEGETIHFQCSVAGHPTPWASWDKDGVLVTPSTRLTIKERDDLRVLELREVTVEDSGLYRVVLENEMGSIEASARLDVIGRNGSRVRSVRAWSASRASPTFGRRLVGSSARVGRNFTLSCDAHASPSPVTSWYRNGELIVHTAKTVPSWDGRRARLELRNLELEDAGVYTCVAENEVGTTRCSAELVVLDTTDPSDADLRPPIFLEGLQPEMILDEGRPLELQTRLQGTLPIEVVWARNGVEIPDCEDFRYVDYGDGRFSLRIADVFEADAGTYNCEAFNAHGDAITSGKLIVKEMCTCESSREDENGDNIAFTKLPTGVVSRPGGTASFCAMVDCPSGTNVTFTWNVAGKPVSADTPRYKVKTEHNTSTLHLTNIATSDRGNVTCTAKIVCPGESPTTITCSAPLNIDMDHLGSAATLVRGPSDTTAMRGDRVMLKATYSGCPEPTVRWLKAGRELISSDRLTITTRDGVSCLQLGAITADDSGKYVVSVENIYGADCHFASVAVEGESMKRLRVKL